MPYAPSVASAAFVTTLASYLADLGFGGLQGGSVPTTPQRALVDALTVYFGLVGGGPPPLTAWAVVAQAGAFTAAAWTHHRVDASGGAVPCTLPAGAANVGVQLKIKKTDASANPVTFTTAGGETTDAPSLIKQGETATLIGHAGGWDIT